MFEKNFFSSLEYLIMLTILKLRGGAYGVPIHEEICRQTGKNLAYGAIYKALKSLSAKGFISSSKGEATPERGGRAKTYYTIKAEGMRALREFEDSAERIKKGFSVRVPEGAMV